MNEAETHQKIPRGVACPLGHGPLHRIVETCHDDDPECYCETIDECTVCEYQHFATCANAVPDDYGEPHDGDTWDKMGRFLRYDAQKTDWLVIR